MCIRSLLRLTMWISKTNDCRVRLDIFSSTNICWNVSTSNLSFLIDLLHVHSNMRCLAFNAQILWGDYIFFRPCMIAGSTRMYTVKPVTYHGIIVDYGNVQSRTYNSTLKVNKRYYLIECTDYESEFTRICSFVLHFELGPCILSFTLEFNSNKQRSFYSNDYLSQIIETNTLTARLCSNAPSSHWFLVPPTAPALCTNQLGIGAKSEVHFIDNISAY